MEHIVQFAIGIDDDAIRQQLVTAAVNDIENSIKKDVLNKILRNYSRRDPSFEKDDFSNLATMILRDLLTEWKTDIVNKAGELLCEYLKRTKAVKDLVEEQKRSITTD